jgi:hypothetical protein
VNKLDTVYFEAIMVANEGGEISPQSIAVLAANARKFAIIEETAESARFYERIFQLWRTLKEQRAVISMETRNAFLAALNEYIAMLEHIGRSERAQMVRDSVSLTD